VGLTPMPLLSIVTATLRVIEGRGLRRVGLLGTSFTMKSDLFQRELGPAGIEIIVPDDDEKEYVQRKIYDELAIGLFRDETRDGLLGVAKGMVERDSIEGLILGCTELPLILEKDEFGIPFFNTTRIHAERAVAYCLED
jgi:aspartate racemase